MPVPLIPILWALILSVAFQIFIGLGVGFLSYTVVLPNLYSFIQQNFNNLPPVIMNVVGILRVDICITIILSAAAAKLATRVNFAKLSSVRN